MQTLSGKLGVVQNEGVADRVSRAVIGWGLLGVAVIDLFNGATVTWHGYAILASVYPLLTSILGWDPFYQIIHAKSCDSSDRNRCGTFPFELSSLFGGHPKCSSDYDCHLTPRTRQKR